MKLITLLIHLLIKLIRRIIKRGGAMTILIILAAAGNSGCATLLTPNGAAVMNSTSGDKNVHGVTDDPVEAAAVLSQAHIAEEEQKVRTDNATHCRQLVDRGFKRLPAYCNQFYSGGNFAFEGMVTTPAEATQQTLPLAEKEKIDKAAKDAACAKRQSQDAVRVAAGKKPLSTSVDPDCK